ncbi:NADH-dependent flavin oxidoreductase [Pseudalkalibacillus salsuginis]|uniref:NADH-dependent flavin oxidoreductase n=1 Tax=Pseudalkalibacillus salsuginis TaxID=2910972 RepID=UPI001F1F3413|nr:NADH-dependent flavin oxidoreductase [Pseudalkalibacillus salsuginis]MCF6410294.1 NADH-dependent flavin oxidoreductase [Pseudalkalibacillus salsuginis]
MNNRYQPMFESLTLPNNIQLKNRIIMAPMTHMSSNADGSISDKELKYYARRANGVSMVITAGTWVMENGGLAGAPAVNRDEMIPGLRKLASVIKEKGAKAILQIFHGGRQSSFSRNDKIVSASAIPEEKEGATLPRKLKESEIIEIIQAFGEATRRAIEAGFDGVEIHGANGGLIQQFFSPHSNRRSDRWGGTLEKRMKFPLELVDEVKRVVKQYAKRPFIVGYRVSPEEQTSPGITMAHTLPFIDALASIGLDYLHVSLNHYWTGPRRGIDDARPRLEIIQERVGDQVPIIGVGSIRTPQDAIKALQSGIPLIALGRELIMEPDWIQKVVQGNEEYIKTTLAEVDQDRLVIPDAQWNLILSVPGWFPVETKQ